jgi:hypothetical protein
VLLSFRFVSVSLVGSLTMALVSTFAPLPAQVATLGACVSILAGLFLAYTEQDDERDRRRAELLEKLQIPVALAPEHEFFDLFGTFSRCLVELARQTDPVLREFALLKLASVAEQLRALAGGRVVWESTEAWGTVYERLLQSPGIIYYRSVAWVKEAGYWQDPPGRQRLRLNFDLVQRGLRIDRIHILRGELWPDGSPLPAPAILPWLREQYDKGIGVSVVRESDLRSEPDLLCDYGIYGDRATGLQVLDENGRTQRFVLHFDRPSVRLALDRWDRLALYAVNLGDLLDSARGGA